MSDEPAASQSAFDELDEALLEEIRAGDLDAAALLLAAMSLQSEADDRADNLGQHR